MIKILTLSLKHFLKIKFKVAESTKSSPMRFLTLLTTLLFATASFAETKFIKLSGTTKRKRQVEPMAIDIEDVLRAEEDPNFATYLKEKEKIKQQEKLEAATINKERFEFEQAQEKARFKCTQNQNCLILSDEENMRAYRQHLQEEKALELQYEKYRQEYVKLRNEGNRKTETERMARFQKAFPDSKRLPASENTKK